jgi:hypothetical protein
MEQGTLDGPAGHTGHEVSLLRMARGASSLRAMGSCLKMAACPAIRYRPGSAFSRSGSDGAIWKPTWTQRQQ